jgi:magnesium transporter
MQREFVAAPDYWTVGQVVDHARAHGDRLPDTFFEIYVLDAAFRLKGTVALARVFRTGREVRLSDIMVEPVVALRPDMDQEEVAFLFQKYSLPSAPVVDEAGRLTGMITIDDIVLVMASESSEDLLALSNVSQASATDTVWDTVKARAPWLGINLITAFLASLVISAFGAALDRIIALAILMPVVAALGGNAGSQALAVAVRAIAERELSGKVAVRAVWREFFTGIVNGALFAVGVAVIAYVWFRDAELSGVLAAAMFATFVWACLVGILVPLSLKRMGADPAVASSVFVLTATDVMGFLTFLGLASWLLM